MIRYLIVVLMFAIVTSCSSNSSKIARIWPADMPPREVFVAGYEADLDNKSGQDLDEYLLWVERFYEGWELYHNGWVKVTADSLHGVKDPVRAAEIKAKMDLIGITVASEWAKSKKDRRVLTRHVVVWGNALIESIKRDQELPLINRVLADVNGLLINKISLEEIKAERYFPKDKDDVFL